MIQTNIYTEWEEREDLELRESPFLLFQAKKMLKLWKQYKADLRLKLRTFQQQ